MKRIWRERFERLRYMSVGLLSADLLLSVAVLASSPRDLAVVDNLMAIGLLGAMDFAGAFAFTVSCIALKRLERSE